MPSATEPVQAPVAQLTEWGGAQRWWVTEQDAATVRQVAAQAGGHATLFRQGAGYACGETGGVFTPLPASLMRIHHGLKRAFDPAGIFNRGRLYIDF